MLADSWELYFFLFRRAQTAGYERFYHEGKCEQSRKEKRTKT